jgi:hypothetical protein
MIIYLNEDIIKEYYDYKTFFPKDELCPHLFHHNSQLKKDVRRSLLDTARSFFDFMEFDWLEIESVRDVWLVGSLASYNWSERYSDVDLHLVMDLTEISDDVDLVKNDLWALKTIYNKNHDISIKGFDVEVYVQDKDEEINSNGIYSVLKQTWIRKPEKREVNIPKKQINSYVNKVEKTVEEALKAFRLNKNKEAKRLAEKARREAIALRKAGLAEDEGEFSAKNLAFKVLRRTKTLDKIENVITKSFDKEVSIDFTNKEKVNRKKEEPEKKKKKFVKKIQPPKHKGHKKEDKPEDDENYSDGITYSINGRKYTSLRDAEKKTGIAKSTLEYRVNSDLPKWRGYRKVT